MKTMTCKQLGGPCDHALRGDTVDEVHQAAGPALEGHAVAGGDDVTGPALGEMKGRWKHPLGGMKWYKNTKKEFADCPRTEPSRRESARSA